MSEEPAVTERPPSPPPTGAPTAVQVLDRLGDIVGVIALALLCSAGKLSGELALLGIGAILGVGTGLRQMGARNSGGGVGLGVLGLLILLSLSAPHGNSSAHEQSAAQEGL